MRLIFVLALNLVVFQSPVCLGEDPLNYSNKKLNFENDVVAHFDPDKTDLNSDISVAFNGWIYIAYSAIHSNPSGMDIELVLSKDSGVTWQQFPTMISGSHNAAFVYDLLVTGTDTNSLRVYLSYNYYDAAFSYSFGHVIVYDGISGLVLPFGVDIGDGTYDIGDVRLASDFHHPASGSSGYSVGVVYSTGHGDFTLTDSLVCLIASDTGTNNYNNYLLDTSSFVSLRGASIDYGFSLMWNKGLYFIAYQKGLKCAYCRNLTTITSGFTEPLILNDILGIADAGLDSSKIVCQNSFNSNDSSGLSVMIVAKALDTSGTNTYRIPMIIYNMQAALTDFWYSSTVESSPDGNSLITFDACYSENEDRFYLAGYNCDSASLFLKIEDFNFSHHGNWYDVDSQYNDSVIDPLLPPNPRITANNNFAFASWNSRTLGAGGLPRSQTLFDRQTLPIITSLNPEIEIPAYTFYPVPANKELIIQRSRVLNFLNEKSVSITDQLGRIVFKKKYGSGIQVISINTAELKNGIYFIQIREENNFTETVKILIQHF